ncbi:MAG: AraC family transcriptional regulator [Eubacterium sp.]|nr:AraC family transcriptional regulator [Eubacterium sp.]
MKRELMGLIVKREDGSEEVNYDDASFPSYIYDGWIRPNVTWEKVPHFHEDVELVTVTCGKMAYSVNGRILELNKGDTIFVNSNQIHYSLSTTEATATYVIFVVNPNILSSSVAVEMQALLPIINNSNLPYIRFRYTNENSKDIYNIMTTLPNVRRDPFQITKKLFEIWEIILTQSKSYGMIDEEIETDVHSKAFKAMMFFIQQSYQKSITLDEIAESGNISKSLCNTIFHKYVGDSPVNYLLNFRVRKVAEYLRTTSLPLSEIAALTGFNGTSYMSEMFKKSFGESPRAYRKTWDNPEGLGESEK